jgi:hypothetical protein
MIHAGNDFSYIGNPYGYKSNFKIMKINLAELKAIFETALAS